MFFNDIHSQQNIGALDVVTVISTVPIVLGHRHDNEQDMALLIPSSRSNRPTRKRVYSAVAGPQVLPCCN